MDMGNLVLDLAAFLNKIFEALIGFIGVIIGAAITYLYQARTIKIQREWDLDNQRREWKRNRMILTLEQYRICVQFATEFTAMPITETSVIKLFTSTNEALSKIDYYEDEKLRELNHLFTEELGKIPIYARNLPEGDADVRRRAPMRTALDNASVIFIQIQKRMNELIEETYN
jgi:hypothetical protein